MPEILGYRRDGTPIHPTKPGFLVTAAVISCANCGHIIKSMGGPAYGALCVPCHTAIEKGENHE